MWAALKKEELCSDHAHLPQPWGRCWCTAGPHQAWDFYPAIRVKMEELWAEGKRVLFSAAGLPLYQVRETGKVHFEVASSWWVQVAQRSYSASSLPPPPALYFYCLKSTSTNTHLAAQELAPLKTNPVPYLNKGFSGMNSSYCFSWWGRHHWGLVKCLDGHVEDWLEMQLKLA